MFRQSDVNAKLSRTACEQHIQQKCIFITLGCLRNPGSLTSIMYPKVTLCTTVLLLYSSMDALRHFEHTQSTQKKQ